MLCQKCSNQIPKRIEIEGVIKNVTQGRRYCFDCQPFRVQKNSLDRGSPIRKCTDCGREFSYRRATGHTKERCNSCVVNKGRLHLKSKLVQYKGGQCLICGYNRCEQALDFHHVDRENKEFEIAGNLCLSFEKLKAEVDKCILICANCHREIHAGFTIQPSYTRPL